jgi:hypothetical protein
MRGVAGFTLISTQKRQALRFDANRMVLRVEGHLSLEAFDELVPLVKDALTTFEVTDLFGASFVSVRARPFKALDLARRTFANTYLSTPARNLVPGTDGSTDLAVLYDRSWLSMPDFRQAKTNPVALLRLREQMMLGPVQYKEIGDRWTEFRDNAENPLYRTKLVAPKFGILADMAWTLDRKPGVERLRLDTLWAFLDWGRSLSDQYWTAIERD